MIVTPKQPLLIKTILLTEESVAWHEVAKELAKALDEQVHEPNPEGAAALQHALVALANYEKIGGVL